MNSFVGRWSGSAEVYDGHGRYVGNGTDSRHVQDLGGGRTRIDVSFVGPLRAAGHYFIQDHGDYRLYQGPVNVGYAETLADGLVDAHAYWASVGLSQRFFLMTVDNQQFSLALMSRGETLIYAIVGENRRVTGSDSPPPFENATSYDLHDDASAGRGEILLHRTGTWRGTLHHLDEARQPSFNSEFCQHVRVSDKTVTIEQNGTGFTLHTNGWQAWTPSGEIVGSTSLYGGRALSGQFHYLATSQRVWRREVVSHDGQHKAVLNVWYRGGERIGIDYGLLAFEPEISA